MKLSSRLIKSRHGIYYFRIQIGGIDKRWSLGTHDPIQASIAAHSISAKILSMKIDPTKIKSWTLKTDGQTIEIQTEDNDADRLSAKEVIVAALQANKFSLADSIHEKFQQDKSQTKSISAAYAEYSLHLPTTDSAIKSQTMALSVIKNLSSLLRPDFDMSELNDDVIEEIWLPHRLKTVSKTTAKRDLSFIKKFVVWATDSKRKYCPQKLTFSFSAKGENWSHFTKNDLCLIFDNLHKKADNPWQFWIPIIALFTGARIGEIASLKPEYISEKTGIAIMRLAGTKTEASDREVPIHNDLIRLGFLEYVSNIRAKNKKQLFDIKTHSQNGAGATASKWFTKYKKSIGLDDRLKVFHSFRPTVVDCLKQNGVRFEERCQYVGHDAGGGTHNEVYARNDLNIKTLKQEVVDKMDYKAYCDFELDFNHLTKKAASFVST
jgi:integrase